MINKAALLVVLCTILDASASPGWTHQTVLDADGRYHLHWTPPVDARDGTGEIMFMVTCQCHGYLGFGLSTSGGMAGSDIVTGWVKDGRVFFQDRYGTENGLPRVDVEQSWHLVEGSENDTHTTFLFKRKLDTCDEEDVPIDDSTMRVIYAYSEEDPPADDPTYHNGRRGTKSMMLLQPKLKKERYNTNPSLLQWDLRSPNLSLPAADTLYWCMIHKTPKLSAKHHVVHVAPLLQKGNEEFVHHMLLYECVGASAEEYDPFVDFQGHQCRHPNMPDVMRRCDGVSVAWAVGGEDVIFPEHVGFPLYEGKFFLLEIHYDNPKLKEGIVDQSGLRMLYTPKLRQHDAGCLMAGATVSTRAFIPPGVKQYTLAGHSNPDCLKPEMPEEGIKALGVLLHAHLAGKSIVARHFRENKELPPLAVERTYDFNYQEYRYYKEEVEILGDDQITVECTYDTSDRKTSTFGGEGTREEMCLAFILYYPRMDRYASVSVPTFDSINQALNTSFTKKSLKDGRMKSELSSYDWTRVDTSEVEHLLRFGKHNTHCYLGSGDKNLVKSTISYPSDLKEFAENSTCGILYSGKDDKEALLNSSASLNSSSMSAMLYFVLLCMLSSEILYRKLCNKVAM